MMTFFNARRSGLMPFFLTLTTSLLHSICCLLPLYASFAVAFSRSVIWRSAQPYLLGMQVLLLLYFVARAVKERRNRNKFILYGLSIVISLAGIGFGMRELVVSREQKQTIRILENLQYQESVLLILPGNPDISRIKQLLAELEGVRWQKTAFENGRLVVHYHSGLVSEEKVLTLLVQNGYQFERAGP